jgi:hypothetical protein
MGRQAAYPLTGNPSGDSRYWQTIPSGRGIPAYGFRKVYDNFPAVRAALGWSISGEQGYLMEVWPSPAGTPGAISLPDGRTIQITNGETWVYASGLPPTPLPSPPDQWTSGATFQPFEHGLMVWRADSGEIRVYIGNYATGGGGTVLMYTVSQYGWLPDIPFSPPWPGRWFPIEFGFGKIWNQMPGVREQIGWAVGGEQGYTMTLTSADGVVTGFSLPDGRLVTLSQDDTWALNPTGQ